MTDTEWTRYAFTLPPDGEAPFSGSAGPLPCEVTIKADGETVIHLGTDYRINSGPIHLNLAQLQLLICKVTALKGEHEA